MATFPSYACILREGYTESSDYGVLRTEMDGGIAKQRARWTKPIVTRQAVIHVKDKNDKISFDLWVKTDLNNGAGWFDYTDPVDGTVKQARIKGGAIQWTTPGLVWRASCELETIG